MEQTNRTQEIELEILKKVPKTTLTNTLEIYSKSVAIETYVKIPFLLIGVLFLIHNVFIAGNSYNYDTYETIKNIEISIVGVIVLVVFIMAGIAMNKNSKVNKHLKEISKRYHIKLKTVQDEFSKLAIYLYGGRGVKLKK